MKPLCPKTYTIHSTASLAEKFYATEAAKGLDAGVSASYSDHFQDSRTYVANVRNARISGPSGTITTVSECSLHYYSTSSWPHVPVHGDLWLSEVWKTNESMSFYDHSLEFKYPPPAPPFRDPPRIHSAATVIDFATTNFFHFLTVTYPRLVYLLPYLDEDPEMALIVPQAFKGHSNRYQGKIVKTLLPQLDHSRFEYYDTSDKPGTRFSVGTLLWVDNDRVVARNGLPTHCLTSRNLLLGARIVAEALAKNSGPEKGSSTSSFLCYAVRRDTSMRKLRSSLDEELTALLKRVAKRFGVELREFDGSKVSFKDAVKTFANSAVVVGVHGAALANVLFSRPGSTLIELGFNAPVSRHYEHLARALDVDYVKIKLLGDEHAMGAEYVDIGDLGLIESAVSNALGTKGSDRDEL